MIKILTKEHILAKLELEGAFKALVRNDENMVWEIKTINRFSTCNGSENVVFDIDNIMYKQCALSDFSNDYEPYNAEETPEVKCGGWITTYDKKMSYLITIIDYDDEEIGHFYFDERWMTNEDLFYNFMWQDGSPIGKKLNKIENRKDRKV